MKSANAAAEKLIILMLMMTALIVLPAAAQSGELPEEDLSESQVFTPYVSRFRTAVSGNKVRLTWIDVPELENERYRLYRSDSEIFPGTLDEAMALQDIPEGTQSYVDELRKNGAYHYALLTLDETGEEIPLLIPFQNKTVLATVINSFPEESRAAGIAAIKASPSDDSIQISYDVVGNYGNISLFRSTSPILNFDDLETAQKVDELPPGQESYSDFVLPGIPYYYAVVDDFASDEDGEILVRGQNTLAEPVELPLGSGFTSLRQGSGETLPILVLNTSVVSGDRLPPSGVEIPSRTGISENTRQAVASLMEPITLDSKPRALPDILPRERELSKAEGRDRVLAEIVQGSFALENYDIARRQLERLLSLSPTGELGFRTRYYYAQSLYFLGRIQDAFLQFLLLQEDGYSIITPWMNRILDELS
ncbi:hypothetical protein [Salinispira pacifica]|nr:hypothetical protein [Salinispira pacifica]